MKFILSLLILFTSSFAIAQSADEIVSKHIEAIGGMSNWSKLNTAYTEFSVDNNGMKIPIKMWASHMKGMRMEFEIQGMKGIQVVTDKDGWSHMPFMGKADPEPTNEEQLKAERSQLDLRGQLVDYKAKGSSIESLGEDVIEGVEVHKIKLTDKDKVETTYFIDKETNFVIKSVTKVTFQGKEMDSETIFSNYKKINDLYFPFTMNSQNGPMEIQKIDLNPVIDEAIFKMPTK